MGISPAHSCFGGGARGRPGRDYSKLFIAAVIAGLHNSSSRRSRSRGGREDLRTCAMADAAAKLAPTVDARAAIDAVPRNYNFAAHITEPNLKAGRANKPVYIDPRGSWTYGQLAERVDCFGHILRSLGVRREERILLALLDTIDWPTAFLGAIKAGVVPIPVNTLM